MNTVCGRASRNSGRSASSMADLAEALAARVVTEHHEQQPITRDDQRRGRCVAVGQREIELLSHQQGKEVGPDEVRHVA